MSTKGSSLPVQPPPPGDDPQGEITTENETEPRKLIVNPAFEELIEPLEAEELNTLREDLRQRGCILPILTWNSMIIDGHTRYRLCNDLNIPFKTQEMEFEDEDAAKIWILTNQVARRNIDRFRRYELLVKRDSLIKLREQRLRMREKNLKQNQTAAERVDQANAEKTPADVSKLDNSENDNHGNIPDDNITHGKTREEIAKELNVGAGTVARMEVIRKKHEEGKVSDDLLAKLRKGKVTVNKVYTEIKNEEKKEKGDAPGAGSPPTATRNRFTAEGLLEYLTGVSSVIGTLQWKDIKMLEPLETRDRILNRLQIIRVHIDHLFDDIQSG
jgi:transposase